MKTISVKYAEEMDSPYLKRLSKWTHDRDGLFRYRNCGASRRMIREGFINRFKPGVVETIAPPPENLITFVQTTGEESKK